MVRAMVLAVLLGVAALAQPTRGMFPWWERPIAKDLNLTDAQTRQIRTTIRDFRGKLIEQRAALEKAELELETALDQDTVDTQRANQAIDDLAKARENLTRTFSQMTLQMRTVLTAQQWQELQKRRGERGGVRQQNRRAPRDQP